MKKVNILSVLVLVMLIALSLLGVFDARASAFIESVMTKNLAFLGVVEEMKLILGGIESVKVPFVSGGATSLTNSLEKAEHYLFITEMITFAQLMIVYISKSWVLKGVTIVLFGATFIKSLKKYAIKVLILLLAINPGLPLYSVAVQKITKDAHIDFGEKYLTKLKAEVAATKKENGLLMEQHAKDIAKINNEHKGIVFFKKIKEDISYDFKRAENTIHGDYLRIRVLISEGGHEMLSKIIGFCSMIVFSMLLLPIGYVALIYFLFNVLFKSGEFQLVMPELTQALGLHTPTNIVKDEEQKTKGFFSRFKDSFKAKEHVIASEIKEKVDNEETTLKAKIDAKANHVKEVIQQKEQAVVADIKEHIEEEKEAIEAKVTQVVDHDKEIVTSKLQEGETELKTATDHIKQEVVNKEQAVKSEVKEYVSSKSEALHQKSTEVINTLKSSLADEVTKAHQELAAHVAEEKARLRALITSEKENITNQVTTIHKHLKTVAQDSLNDVQKVDDEIQKTDESDNKNDDNSKEFGGSPLISL